MTRCIHLEAHLSVDALARRYRGTTDPVERSRWRFLWLLARGSWRVALGARFHRQSHCQPHRILGVLDRPDRTPF
jgi:hypothetical protein